MGTPSFDLPFDQLPSVLWQFVVQFPVPFGAALLVLLFFLVKPFVEDHF